MYNRSLVIRDRFDEETPYTQPRGIADNILHIFVKSNKYAYFKSKIIAI